jgi:pyruvate dehydrogenase E1 component alpha subunit
VKETLTTKILQVIKTEGSCDASQEPTIQNEDLVKLFKTMVMIRNFDQKALNMQRQGRIGFYVPCAGQEAAQVGSAFALKAEDWTFPTYRDQGVAILRGVPLRTLLCHLIGNSEDLMKGRQMPNHWGFKSVNYVSVAAPIASHLPVAVGVSMGMKIRGEKKVVMAYHGDGATSEGDFHVAMNFAGVYKAPVVFICENNQYAISVPVTKQTAVEALCDKAKAYGFEGIRVDGNDVLAVYRASKEAVDKARKGEGPTMVECLTYRMGPHSTSDDPKRYRSTDEVEEWRKKDPIERFKLYLHKKGILDEKMESKIRAEVEGEINEAIKSAEEVPPPVIETMFGDVYSSETWNLREQLEEAMESQGDREA